MSPVTYPSPFYPFLPLGTITPWCDNAIGGTFPTNAASTSAVYPSANRATIYPFTLWRDEIIYKFFVINGTVVSGNFDMGVYTKDFIKLRSTGSTAQAGTSAIQQVTLGSPFSLSPGRYYFAFVADNVTATFFQNPTTSNSLTIAKCFQMATAFPLPTTITPVAISSSYMPFAGIRLKNV